ncbi:MAG: DNA recombination protein RmuC [Methermicoccaceae archaeon]
MDPLTLLAFLAILEAVALIAVALLSVRRTREGESSSVIFGELSRSLQELGSRLGELTSLTQSTHDVASSLDKVMSGDRTRGRLGELMLEHILRDSLPADAFLSQVMVGSKRVDFALKVGDLLVPVDCKFPYPAHEGMLTAESEAERRRYRAELLRAVRGHIDAVGAYVKPQMGTSELAIMYVPTESLYLSIIQDTDTIGYAHERRVVICSPATIHYVLFLLSELVRRERLPEVLEALDEGLEAFGSQLSEVLDEFSTLERHISNASSKSHELGGALDALRQSFGSLERVRKR